MFQVSAVACALAAPNNHVPIKPTQTTLILAAGIASLLWAVWTAVRAVHPRWRKSGWECYVRSGQFVFLLALGLEFVGVAEGWDFFTRNPKHILILPGTGAAICVLVVLPAVIVDEWRKRTQMTRATQPIFTWSDEAVVRFAIAYLWLLALMLPLMIFGLYGQLFGPTWTFFIGVAGFVSAMGVFGLSRAEIGKRFVTICSRGLSDRFPALLKLDVPLRRSLKLTAAIAAIALAALAVSARWDGVAGTPVFTHRAHYVLVNHGVATEVSRIRYCLAGAGFHVGWYSGALFAMLQAISALIFARNPDLKGASSRTP